MNIINLHTLTDFERYDKQPHYCGATHRLAQKLGARRLGFHIEVIDPGNFSCPYHYHTAEEELFLVLEGEAVVRIDNKFYRVGPGDLIFYPVGSEFAHNMYNHTDKPFKFFALSNDGPDADMCYYPDSKKNTSAEGIIQNGLKVGYYKDEEDPAKYWPEYALRGDVEEFKKL